MVRTRAAAKRAASDSREEGDVAKGKRAAENEASPQAPKAKRQREAMRDEEADATAVTPSACSRTALSRVASRDKREMLQQALGQYGLRILASSAVCRNFVQWGRAANLHTVVNIMRRMEMVHSPRYAARFSMMVTESLDWMHEKDGWSDDGGWDSVENPGVEFSKEAASLLVQEAVSEDLVEEYSYVADVKLRFECMEILGALLDPPMPNSFFSPARVSFPKYEISENAQPDYDFVLDGDLAAQSKHFPYAHGRQSRAGYVMPSLFAFDTVPLVLAKPHGVEGQWAKLPDQVLLKICRLAGFRTGTLMRVCTAWRDVIELHLTKDTTSEVQRDVLVRLAMAKGQSLRRFDLEQQMNLRSQAFACAMGTLRKAWNIHRDIRATFSAATRPKAVRKGDWTYATTKGLFCDLQITKGHVDTRLDAPHPVVGQWTLLPDDVLAIVAEKLHVHAGVLLRVCRRWRDVTANRFALLERPYVVRNPELTQRTVLQLAMAQARHAQVTLARQGECGDDG